MKITDVRFTMMKEDKGNLKAFVSVTFEDCLIVTGIRLLDGKNGLFISFPQNKDSEGEYHDIVFPNSKEGREAITEKIIEAYNEASKDSKGKKAKSFSQFFSLQLPG